MKSQKSLKAKNTLKNSAQPNNKSSVASVKSSSGVKLSDQQPAQSASASIVSKQTINAMINSLKEYNQEVNFKPKHSVKKSKSSTTSAQLANAQSAAPQSHSSSQRSSTKNRVHFASSASKVSTKNREMDSLADSLFNNILSISSSSNEPASSSATASQSVKISFKNVNRKPGSLKNKHSNESSNVTNSGILSEFTSAENSLNHQPINSATPNQQARALNVAQSAALSGMNNSLSFNNTVNNQKTGHHSQYSYHQIDSSVREKPRQGLHGYQKSINAHYSRHILLILIIVTICCSFAGIIGYAATLV